jgi:hypothetical protein
VLGTVYVIASGAPRAVFPDGPVTDFGPPALACVLLAIFFVFGQDRPPPAGTPEA